TMVAAASNLRDLHDMTIAELEQEVIVAGEAPYRARQIMRWLWIHGVSAVEAMHDVPARLRHYLIQHFRIGRLEAPWVARSADGTRKLLVRLDDGAAIESVIIPTDGRTTLCLSTQAGCAMGCQFCATARMGLQRNLTAGEILGQIIAARPQCAESEH